MTDIAFYKCIDLCNMSWVVWEGRVGLKKGHGRWGSTDNSIVTAMNINIVHCFYQTNKSN